MTHWFDVEPGSDVGVSQEEPCLLFGIDPPDWIRVPDHPGLPGGQRRVLEAITAKCVHPGHDHPSRHYVLDGPVQVCVCQYERLALWYTRKEANSGGQNDGSTQGDSNQGPSQG